MDRLDGRAGVVARTVVFAVPRKPYLHKIWLDERNLAVKRVVAELRVRLIRKTLEDDVETKHQGRNAKREPRSFGKVVLRKEVGHVHTEHANLRRT